MDLTMRRAKPWNPNEFSSQELAKEFFALKIKRRADIIFEELWNQIDGPSQVTLETC